MESEGRSLVISLGILIVSIFAMIPGPIIFGTVVGKDNVCTNNYNLSKRI